MNEYMKDAVPEGWQVVPKDPTSEMLDAAEGVDLADEDMRGSCCNLWNRMLAAAPAPDHFRDAKEMVDDPDPLHLSRILHELAGAASLCWEPRPTGVFDSQLAIQFVEQALAEIRSRMTPAPAEVLMPKPVAYGLGNTAITGHINRLMMVRIDIPGGDQYAGAFWLPLVLADEARTYGDAREAAGYARGLKSRAPLDAINKMLADCMDVAGQNGANSVSMPDHYVEVAAWVCGIKDDALRGEVKS